MSGSAAVRAIDFNSGSVRTLGSATDPRGVVFDPVTNRVFFGDRGGTGALKSFAAAGGDPQTHLTNLAGIADLRADRQNRIFYWCQESAGMIRSAPFTAVDPAIPATIFSGLSAPYYLDLDLPGNRIYWSQNGTSLFFGPLGGGASSTFDSGGNMNRGIGVNAANGFVYWCQRNEGVYRKPIGGGSVQTIYGLGSPTNTNLNTPHGLLLDLPAGKVYWTDTGTNEPTGPASLGVYRGDLEGSGTPEVLFPGAFGTNQTWDLDLDPRTPDYEQWRARFFRFDAPAPSTGKLADFDSDGASNLAEYAFGSRPASGASLPVIEPLRINESSVEYGAVRFRRRVGATDLSYRVQVSPNLSDWPDNTTAPGTTVEVGVPTAVEDGVEMVTVRSTTPASNLSRQFFRVKVISP